MNDTMNYDENYFDDLSDKDVYLALIEILPVHIASKFEDIIRKTNKSNIDYLC